MNDTLAEVRNHTPLVIARLLLREYDQCVARAAEFAPLSPRYAEIIDAQATQTKLCLALVSGAMSVTVPELDLGPDWFTALRAYVEREAAKW